MIDGHHFEFIFDRIPENKHVTPNYFARAYVNFNISRVNRDRLNNRTNNLNDRNNRQNAVEEFFD